MSEKLHTLIRFGAAAGALALAMPALATADLPAASAKGLAQLEEAYWYCDFVSDTQGWRGTPIAACSVVTERLKKEKFAGDFEKYLEWWRSNKAEQHRKLHELSRSEAIL